MPVHVITANDYLARRDGRAAAAVLCAPGPAPSAASRSRWTRRRAGAAYACDITYCTAKELVFDYLRDRIASGAATPGPCTSASAGSAPAQRNRAARPVHGDHRRSRQRAARRSARAVHPVACRGATRAAPSISSARSRLPRAWSRAGIIRSTPSSDSAELTHAGREALAVSAQHADRLWALPRYREEAVSLALCALHLFHRDRDYLVRDGRVEIIDETTGRTAPGRAWSRGLHQMIELKEGCSPGQVLETAAADHLSALLLPLPARLRHERHAARGAQRAGAGVRAARGARAAAQPQPRRVLPTRRVRERRRAPGFRRAALRERCAMPGARS